MTSTFRKPKILILEKRIEVVRSDGGETAVSISKSLKVGETQIQKAAIRKSWKNGGNAERKYSKQRKFISGDSNENLWKWFFDCRRRNIPLSGRMIQELAAIESTVFGHN